MTKYKGKAYCSLCGRWMDIDKVEKKYIPKSNVVALYCPIHKKQLRLKGRSTPMGSVKIYDYKKDLVYK